MSARYSPGDSARRRHTARIRRARRPTPRPHSSRANLGAGRRGRGLAAVLEALTGAYGTSLSAIPPFAVVLAEGDSVRLAVRGDIALDVEATTEPSAVSGTRRDDVERARPHDVTRVLGRAPRAPTAPAEPRRSPTASCSPRSWSGAPRDRPITEPAERRSRADARADRGARRRRTRSGRPDRRRPRRARSRARVRAAEPEPRRARPEQPAPLPVPPTPRAPPRARRPRPSPALIDSAPCCRSPMPTPSCPRESTFTVRRDDRAHPMPSRRRPPPPAAERRSRSHRRPRRAPAAAAGVVGDHDGETISLAQARALRAPATRPAGARRRSRRRVRPRPGGIRVSTGQVVALDRTVVHRPPPRSTRVTGTDLPHLIAVDSPQQDISRSHVELRVEGDSIIATDLHTTNGTTLLRAGRGSGAAAPGRGDRRGPGDVLDLGDGITVAVEDLP